MLKISLSLALMLAVTGTFANAGPVKTAAPPALTDRVVTQMGCNGSIDAPTNGASRQVRRQGNCNTGNEGASSGNKRKIINRRVVDCHRDVRTHRVGGIRLTHRHVGDNCAIREVRRSN